LKNPKAKRTCISDIVLIELENPNSKQNDMQRPLPEADPGISKGGTPERGPTPERAKN
jgi:hypothetical protein